VLSGGQKLTIDHGKAVGGEVNLDAITGDHDVMRAANFVISKNVTITGDFSKRSDFKLLGDLNNFGTVLATSTDVNKRSGAIRVDDINNFSGATIKSTIDLTLDAAGNLNNDGTIISSAGLTLVAGNAINNGGTISAKNDVSVLSSKVNNIKGQITSTTGNVNLEGTSDAALIVNNHGGTISAVNGAINARDAAYGGGYEVNADIESIDSIELVTESAKGKIAFAADVVVRTNSTTNGDIDISVEPFNPAIPAPLPRFNVNFITQLAGTVTLTGSGLKAKSPTSTIEGLDADLTVNNGLKTANITFGGNNTIRAQKQ